MKDLDLMKIIFDDYLSGKYKLMTEKIMQYDRKDFFNDLFGFINLKYEGYSNSSHLYHK